MDSRRARANGAAASKAIAAVAVIAVLAAVAIYLNFGGGNAMEAAGQVHYVDLATGKLFSAPADQPLPVPAPSQESGTSDPQGVRAYVYSCGSCDESKFIGYVETHTQEYRQNWGQIQNMQRAPAAQRAQFEEIAREGVQVAAWSEDAASSPELQWVSKAEEGQEIVQSMRQRCPQGSLTLCTP